MKNRPFFLILAFALTALFIVGCGDDDEEPTSTNVPPATPSNLAAIQTFRSQVNLSWSNVADEDSFVVQRSMNNTAWNALANVAANVLTAVDPGISANTEHWYRVASKNVAGTSAYSTAVSIWTWPAVYDFSDDQTDMFTAQIRLEGTSSVAWTWDETAATGKFVMTYDDNYTQWADLYTDETMPNQGWFETGVKLEAWQGTDTLYYYACKDVDSSRYFVGLIFTQSHTYLRYWQSSGTQVVTSGMPVLSAGSFHTIRIFHEGTNWAVYFDGTEIWNQSIADQGENSWGYVQEWQFDPGSAPSGDYTFWIDDVANPAATPTLIQSDGSRSPHRSTLDSPRRAVKK